VSRRIGLGLASGLAIAVAIELAAPRAALSGHDLWQRAAGPAPDPYRQAMARGDHYALRAAEQETLGHGEPANSLALRAVDAYERAAASDARAVEPHYRAAEVLYLHFVEESDHPHKHPTERAIRHWAEFERKAPRDPRLESIYFRRSLAYTKLGGPENYRRAASDYEKELRLIDPGSAPEEQMARVLSNAGEIYMALGELDRALTLYYDSIEFATQSQRLYAFGLAVALDRDGQGVKARETIRRFGGYSYDVLKPPEGGVFFIPDGDEHYYHALGLETAGQVESAINHYRQFMRLQPRSPYVERARHNIDLLEARLRGKGSKRDKAGQPSDTDVFDVGSLEMPKRKTKPGAKTKAGNGP
jgi:tetratricopeptide (TPR) repeat protein